MTRKTAVLPDIEDATFAACLAPLAGALVPGTTPEIGSFQQVLPERPGPPAIRSDPVGLAPSALANSALANSALASSALASSALASSALASSALASSALASSALANSALANSALANSTSAGPALAHPALVHRARGAEALDEECLMPAAAGMPGRPNSLAEWRSLADQEFAEFRTIELFLAKSDAELLAAVQAYPRQILGFLARLSGMETRRAMQQQATAALMARLHATMISAATEAEPAPATPATCHRSSC